MKLRYITNSLFAFSLSIILAVSLGSCTKRAVLDEYNNDEDLTDVDVLVDYSELSLSDVSGIYTVILYPNDGSEYEVFVLDEENSTIELENGAYSAIIFNGDFEDYSSIINFEDMDKYTTVRISAADVDNFDVSDLVIYVDAIDYFMVTDDSTTLNFKLNSITTTLFTSAFIPAGKDVADEGSYTVISGMAISILLYNLETTGDPTSITMNLTKDYTTDEFIKLSGQTLSFGQYKYATGTHSDAKLYLKSATSEEYSESVSTNLEISTTENSSYKISTINIYYIE